MKRLVTFLMLLCYSVLLSANIADGLIATSAMESRFSIAIGDDGRAYTVGDNTYGQLASYNGPQTPPFRSTWGLAHIPGLPQINFVATSAENAAMVVTASGEVWAWGGYAHFFIFASSYFGCSSDSDCVIAQPVKLPFPSGVKIKKVSLGRHTGLALSTDGKVYLLKKETAGGIQNVKTGEQELTNIVDVKTSVHMNYALSADGHVYAWLHELHSVAPPHGVDGLGNESTTPLRYYTGPGLPLTGVKAISIQSTYTPSHDEFAHALMADGTIAFLHGDAIQATISMADDVLVNSGFKAIASGDAHLIALKANGDVWVKGENDKGQLGDGNPKAFLNHSIGSNKLIITNPEGKIEHPVAVIATEDASFAVLSDGHLYAWGVNNNGALGVDPSLNVTHGNYQLVTRPSFVNNFRVRMPRQLASGSAQSFFSRISSEVLGVGSSSFGGLGVSGARTESYQFESLALPLSFDHLNSFNQKLYPLKITSADSSGFVLLSNGRVAGWGLNNGGQLGIGNQVNQNIPAQINNSSERSASNRVLPFDDVIDIVTSSTHSLALKADGSVWAWGSNNFAQLGDGSKVSRQQPLKIYTLSDIKAIAVGENHSVALSANGQVYRWGQVDFASEIPSDSDVSIPQLLLISNIIEIAAGARHVLLLSGSGEVYGYGDNSRKQLGLDAARVSLPQSIIASTVQNISAGRYQSFIYLVEGSHTVWKAWGSNKLGELGAGPGSTPGALVSSPIVIASSSDKVRYLTGGGPGSQSTLLEKDNYIYASGKNDWGQLGRADRCEPLPVESCGQAGFDIVWRSSLYPFEHPAFQSNCASCHDGSTAPGKSGDTRYGRTSHILTTDLCESCHTISSFTTLKTFDHTQAIGTCSSCHLSDQFKSVVIQRPSDHIPASEICENCHSTIAFLPTTNFDHNDAVGVCSECHGQNNRYNIASKPPSHLSTSERCEFCHNTVSFTNLIDFAHTEAYGACASCHDGFKATGKAVSHVTTQMDCSYCHNAQNFVPLQVTHITLDVACDYCHGGSFAYITAKSPTHISLSS